MNTPSNNQLVHSITNRLIYFFIFNYLIMYLIHSLITWFCARRRTNQIHGGPNRPTSTRGTPYLSHLWPRVGQCDQMSWPTQIRSPCITWENSGTTEQRNASSHSILRVSRGVPMVALADGVNSSATPKLCGGICLLSIVSVSRGVPMVDLADGVNASATLKLSGGICPLSIWVSPVVCR